MIAPISLSSLNPNMMLLYWNLILDQLQKMDTIFICLGCECSCSVYLLSLKFDCKPSWAKSFSWKPIEDFSMTLWTLRSQRSNLNMVASFARYYGVLGIKTWYAGSFSHKDNVIMINSNEMSRDISKHLRVNSLGQKMT